MLTRWPSSALSSDWHREMPRWAPASAITSPASNPISVNTGVSDADPPAAETRLAPTTASTMRAPTNATPAGSRPAISVSSASATVSGRLVLHTSDSARPLKRNTPTKPRVTSLESLLVDEWG